MNFENIIVTLDEGLATVTINRPKKLNALNKATILELNAAFSALEDEKTVKSTNCKLPMQMVITHARYFHRLSN